MGKPVVTESTWPRSGRVCAVCCAPEELTLTEWRMRDGTVTVDRHSSLERGACKDREACLSRQPQLDLGLPEDVPQCTRMNEDVPEGLRDDGQRQLQPAAQPGRAVRSHSGMERRDDRARQGRCRCT